MQLARLCKEQSKVGRARHPKYPTLHGSKGCLVGRLEMPSSAAPRWLFLIAAALLSALPPAHSADAFAKYQFVMKVQSAAMANVNQVRIYNGQRQPSVVLTLFTAALPAIRMLLHTSSVWTRHSHPSVFDTKNTSCGNSPIALKICTD